MKEYFDKDSGITVQVYEAQSVTYEFEMGTGYKTKILTPLDSCDTVEFIQ
jgi:hypothetical protein